jgi:putative endonuclease
MTVRQRTQRGNGRSAAMDAARRWTQRGGGRSAAADAARQWTQRGSGRNPQTARSVRTDTRPEGRVDRPGNGSGGYTNRTLPPHPMVSFRPQGGICFTAPMHRYHVYILASRSRTLYVGVTGDIIRRILQHKQRHGCSFTMKYRVDRLVHLEETDYVIAAIAREKELKSWRREKKIALIESANPAWSDLAGEWYDPLAMTPLPLRA